MTIVVLRPTRGLEYAESAQSIEGGGRVILRTWSLPIPDSFNRLVQRFLEGDGTHAWFVEEDVVVPAGGLDALLALDTDIAAINYRLKTDQRLSEMRRNGRLVWVSLGCTLIKRRVFETLPEPWFSTDYALVSRSTGSACKEKILDMQYSPRQYSGHDAYLCFNALKAGFTLGVVEGMLCEHLKLDAMGEPNTNAGCHKIGRV